MSWRLQHYTFTIKDIEVAIGGCDSSKIIKKLKICKSQRLKSYDSFTQFKQGLKSAVLTLDNVFRKLISIKYF